MYSDKLKRERQNVTEHNRQVTCTGNSPEKIQIIKHSSFQKNGNKGNQCWLIINQYWHQAPLAPVSLLNQFHSDCENDST